MTLWKATDRTWTTEFGNRCFAHLAAAALCLFSVMASAGEDAQAAGSSFLRLVRSGDFENAAKEFRYPASYTADELQADQRAIARSLKSLFQVTGSIQGTPKVEFGAFASIMFRINAGDRSHPLPKSDPANLAAFRFAVALERYRDAAINLELEPVEGRWKIRSFTFALPASDPSSPVRMKQILDRVMADEAS